MPKYIPDDNDLYETKPCFICGRDVIVPGEDTCSDICKAMKINFEEDWEWFQWKDYEGEEDNW